MCLEFFGIKVPFYMYNGQRMQAPKNKIQVHNTSTSITLVIGSLHNYYNCLKVQGSEF